MNISILTLFPDLYTAFLNTSLIKHAQTNQAVSFKIINLLDFCEPKRRVDEPTVGPGPGMILRPDIIETGIKQAESDFGPGFKIFFSPKGTLLDQLVLNQLATALAQTTLLTKTVSFTTASPTTNHLILVSSRYEGIDHRVEQKLADLLLSVGDYVLLGGDLPCQIFLEGLLRLIPGVVGNQSSTETESFQSPFLDHPEYGLPIDWHGEKIPEVLQSGHHQKIKTYRLQESVKLTLHHRFDWLRTHPAAKDFTGLISDIIPNHYVALMHAQVETREAQKTTSVTSIDLHDIARSCATYGIQNFFVVTPLKDQQAIVTTFLDFWKSKVGMQYNKSRFEAVSSLILLDSLVRVVDKIQEFDGKKPLIITTSAKHFEHRNKISFFDQGKVWSKNQPVLIVLGTGCGLEQNLIEQSDFLLDPIEGFSNYNHLSVRSAAGIILDRWMGFNPKHRLLDLFLAHHGLPE